MSPFVTLAFYTMLNLAGNQVRPKQENSIPRLLHTGLALGLVRLDIELSADSDQSEQDKKKTRKRKTAVVTGSNAIPINGCYSHFSSRMSSKHAKSTPAEPLVGTLPHKPPGRALTLPELEAGLRAAAAKHLGEDLVEKLVRALKVEHNGAPSGDGPVRRGVHEVAVRYLGADLVRDIEKALEDTASGSTVAQPPANKEDNPSEAAAKRLANLSMGNYPPEKPTTPAGLVASPSSPSEASSMSWADQAEAADARRSDGAGGPPAGPHADHAREEPGQRGADGAAALTLPYRNIRQTPPRILADGQRSKEKIKRPIKTSGYEIPFRYRELVPWETACGRCGSEHHVGCSRRVTPCSYPLCRDPPQSHAITSCPHLHQLCVLCRSRGHDQDQCVERDQEDLAEIFRKFAPEGRFTRRGVRAKAPITDWDFEGPPKEVDELSEIHLLEKVVAVDWGSESLDEFASHDVNGKYWQLEREILK